MVKGRQNEVGFFFLCLEPHSPSKTQTKPNKGKQTPPPEKKKMNKTQKRLTVTESGNVLFLIP